MGLIHYENGFDDLIKDIAVVDFYATWCGPCKMFGPVFEDVSMKSNINFVKVDVDKENDIARRYGVMTIPTVILFKNGKEVKRNIGYMFQNYALFPNMTVYDNIASPLVARILDKTIIHDSVIRLMKELHIEGLEKRYPRQLSGGQKQRVALARLLIYNAEAILLDEPFSALDEDLKGELLKEMKTKLDAYHRPVVFVSHNKDEIKTLSHEMYIIKKGEMIHEEIS